MQVSIRLSVSIHTSRAHRTTSSSAFSLERTQREHHELPQMPASEAGGKEEEEEEEEAAEAGGARAG